MRPLPEPASLSPERPLSLPIDLPADLLDKTLNMLDYGLVITDPRQFDNPVIYVNAAFTAMTGYRPDEIVGRNCRLLQGPETDPAGAAQIREAITCVRPCRVTLLNYRKDGTTFWNECRLMPHFSPDGTLTYFVGIQIDVTDQLAPQRRLQEQEIQRQLRHNALHDSLTGLPNRTLLSAKLASFGTLLSQEPNRRIALLFIDIDRFKVVNDTMGHLAGDQLLLAFSQRVRQTLRQHDMLVRLGGDEFVVVIDPVSGDADALAVAGAIHQLIEQPFVIDAREVYITASIGVAISGDTFHRPEYLLRNADIAMRRAKADGPQRYAVFDAALHQQTVRRVQLEQDLRQAIEHQKIRLYYQPIITMDGGRLLGFEALARWENPHLGMIPPAEFISIVEDIGLMLPLTYQFIDQISAQLAAWRKDLPGSADLYVSLNVMSRPLLDLRLAAYCGQALRRNDLPTSSLAIEITENILIENAEVVRALNDLERAGHPLLLDDFGTGYSSLHWLRRLNLHAIKIDRSFISGATADLSNGAIVRTIISLAQSLGLSVIAEGVETEQQRAQLHTLGAQAFQGYLVAPALSPGEATAFLARP